MKLLEPMKAPSEIIPFNDQRIRYPMWESQKYDGFRLINLCGERLISPKMKDFANQNLKQHLNEICAYAKATRTVYDGELWSPELTFSELSSVLRSHHKDIPASVHYYVFDALREREWDGDERTPTFENRMWRYVNDLQSRLFTSVETVFHSRVETAEDAEAVFRYRLSIGQEGSIIRSGTAGYKHGRCTHDEAAMFKFKEFETHDAIIVGYIRQREMRDDIERTRNALGRLERPHSKLDFDDTEAIGAFEVMWEGVRFKVKPGKGFTQLDRRNWFHMRDQLIGKHIEFSYMPHGTKDKPRIGSLVRFRPDKDI